MMTLMWNAALSGISIIMIKFKKFRMNFNHNYSLCTIHYSLNNKGCSFRSSPSI